MALDRKTGARALRSIVEESLLEVMYDIPERTEVLVIITEETIRSGRLPLLLTRPGQKGVDETNYEGGSPSAASADLRPIPDWARSPCSGP